MKYGRIVDGNDRSTLISSAMRAVTVLERMRGLLGRPPLAPDEALLLSPCRSIHTIGMRYPIDVVFLASNWRIKKVIDSLPPLRMAWSFGSAMTLELPAGTASRLRLLPGRELAWDDALG